MTYILSEDIILELLQSRFKWELIELFYANSVVHFETIRNLYSTCVINPMVEFLTLNGISYKSFFNFKHIFICFVIRMNYPQLDPARIPAWMTPQMIDNSLYFYNSIAKLVVIYIIGNNYNFICALSDKKNQLESIFLEKLANYMYINICSGNVNAEFLDFISKIISY